MTLVLVVGGARSGKSEVAERLATDAAAPVLYVATGERSDAEMEARIEAHITRRPPAWETVETFALDRVFDRAGERTVLLDSVGAWVAGELFADRRDRLLARVRRFAQAARARPGLTVVVSEEAGLGVVPVAAVARAYLDLAGEANQIIARAAERVLLVVAGRPLELPAHAPPAADASDLRRHADTMVPPGCGDFAVNVQAAGPPDFLRRALVDALDQVGAYPDERHAVEAVARQHGRRIEEVVLTNGAAEAFWLIAGALRPHHAVCVHPSFTEPEAALRSHGLAVTRVLRAAEDFALDPDRVPPEADLVVLGNPNNPSGTLDPAAQIERLCRPGRVVVVDEAFMDFVPGERESLASRRDLPGLVVVRSLTKLWSLPGVRVGYALADESLARRLGGLRAPWSVNCVALAAIRAWAGRPRARDPLADAVAQAREPLREALASLPGVLAWPGVANFLLIKVHDGGGVHRRLLERGVAVRPCDSFPGLDTDYLRITVRDREANERLVAALAEALTPIGVPA